MRINRHVTAFLVCFSLLFMLAGCSDGKKEEAATDERVSYSLLVCPGRDKTSAQEEAVRAVDAMLSSAVLDPSDETLTLENTSGFPLTGVIIIRHFDGEGVFIGESRISVDEWPAGGRMAAVASRDSAGWSAYDSADIGMKVLVDGVYVMTDYQPLNTGTDAPFNVRMWKELPLRLIFEDYNGKRSYLLWNMETIKKNDISYSVRFTVTMESGRALCLDGVDFRFLRSSDNVIEEGGSSYIKYLNPGETIWIDESIDHLDTEGGSYILELFGAEIESATQVDVDAAGSGSSSTPPPTDTKKPAVTPAPIVQRGAWEAALSDARKLKDEGKYYEAALAIASCREKYPDSEKECNALMDEIAKTLKSAEPKTGELERHFPFQGPNCARLMALSGPLDVTITDADDGKKFVHFYVRKGETSEIWLPAASYTYVVKIGQVWFNDEIGFGELCEIIDSGSDTLEMHSHQEGYIRYQYNWTKIF